MNNITNDAMSRIVLRAIRRLDQTLIRSNVDSGHGILHAKAVLRHVNRALDCERELARTYALITPWEELSVKLAALLHDADDSKFFDTKNYANARMIISHALSGFQITTAQKKKIVDLAIEMIGLVSCSKNLNSPPPDKQMWKLLPRYADRLEAMGHIGIFRAYEYSIYRNRPLVSDNTPIVHTREDIEAIATADRFANYRVIRESESFIDHFYDKILHLIDMTKECNNKYINEVAESRHNTIVNFLITHSQTGVIDGVAIKRNMYADRP